ncbi:MAG TPA: hypothetical protein V6D08_06400 [Candidatus Obscuribacterales bacterium]
MLKLTGPTVRWAVGVSVSMGLALTGFAGYTGPVLGQGGESLPAATGTIPDGAAGQASGAKARNWSRDYSNLLARRGGGRGGGKRKQARDSGGIAGYWSSDWGTVHFTQGPLLAGGYCAIGGTWEQAPHKIGSIMEGQYYPQEGGGNVKFKYYLPWKHMTGHAVLSLSPDGRMLSGTWRQPDGSGTWTMTR